MYPDGRPSNSSPAAPQWKTGANLVTRSAQGGWAVRSAVLNALSKDLRGAQQAAAQASQRMFSGRYRGEAQTAAESALGIVRALEAEADRLGKEREEELKRREIDADAMRASADARLKESMSSLADAMRRLPPGMSPWSSPSWLSWTPIFAHSQVLLGMLRPQAGKAPGKNHGFGWDAPTPVYVSVREALRVNHGRPDRDTAHALARSLLLRALACTPPGKLRLAIFDPTGLGQSVSSLLELGEYDRDLIGGKVWSSTDDLRRLLAEHAAHIELVIQKYLRARVRDARRVQRGGRRDRRAIPAGGHLRRSIGIRRPLICRAAAHHRERPALRRLDVAHHRSGSPSPRTASPLMRCRRT